MGMIGIITGLIASVIDIAVEYTSDLKFTYVKHCILYLHTKIIVQTSWSRCIDFSEFMVFDYSDTLTL